MANSCVAFGCTNRSGSDFCFQKIPCDKERQELWLIALKLATPPNLKHAHVCCEHFPEDDYYQNHKSELTGRSAKSRYLSKSDYCLVYCIICGSSWALITILNG